MRELVLKLKPQTFSPNDYICRIGEVGERTLYKACAVGGGVKANYENPHHIIIAKKLYFDKIKE